MFARGMLMEEQHQIIHRLLLDPAFNYPAQTMFSAGQEAMTSNHWSGTTATMMTTISPGLEKRVCLLDVWTGLDLLDALLFDAPDERPILTTL
jgi:hypothetical protein